jgi:hypothetical protein
MTARLNAIALEAAQGREAIAAALALGVCRPPLCGGSLRPWAPLVVPPALNKRVLAIMLQALCALNEDYLREHPQTPSLYRAGVWYEQEPRGHEQWLSIPWILMRRDSGRGVDCEDLACYRIADLRVRGGEPSAAPYVTDHVDRNGQLTYHIRVRRKSGEIEDPSLNLGMNATAPARTEAAAQWRELAAEHPIEVGHLLAAGAGSSIMLARRPERLR